MTDVFDKFNTVDPTLSQSQENTTQQSTEGATADNTSVVQNQGQQSTEQVDTFFDTFNKRFGTQYKTDEELKPLFDLPKKVKDYEEKYKNYDDLVKSNDQYKRNLENLKQEEAQRYLSHPLMQKAYIAKQLVEKHPDCDPSILSEIAMSDISKMDDIEAIAKERKVNLPELSIEDIKTVILHDLGIDPATDPKDREPLAKAQLKMKGAEAKANLKKLVQGIELPKIETAEEAQKKETENLAKRTEILTPFKAKFSQYDKFKVRDDLDYTVDDDFKTELPKLFDIFMLKNNLEPTEENLAALEDFREWTFFSKNKDKILEAMYKDVQTKLKKQEDIENGNTVPPNTSTASDALGEKPKSQPNHEDFIRDTQGSKVRRMR